MMTLITTYGKNVAFQYATTCFEPPSFPHGDMILKHLPQTHLMFFLLNYQKVDQISKMIIIVSDISYDIAAQIWKDRTFLL